MLGAAAPGDDDEDEELKRAIELSLQDSQGFAISPEFRDQGPKSQQPPPSTDENDENDEEDDEMKAAIAASLKEYQQQETIKQQQQQQHQQFNQQSVGQLNQPSEPESDFYNISIPQYQPYPSDQFNQQQIQPGQQYQQYNETGPQPQYPPPPAPQQPPKVEDLSQQEEENINLFITLMNSIKNDRKKRANILYDSDLNELHAKVITLKPKVNKSLRLAIEKYEAFLELNNKISTVSKLYDEFLESKLSMAYNNQSLASTQHTGGPNYFQSASQANQYGGFVEDQSTGVSQTYSNPQYSNDQFVGQQNSGYNQRYDYQSNVNPQNLNPPGSNPQLANHSVINPQYTASSTTEKRRSQYDTESSMKQPATTFNQPSEPLYGQDNEQSNYSYSSQPRYDEIPELTPEDSDKEYLSKIPINYTNEVDEQTIPYPPVSPPLNNADNTDLQASLPATTNTVRRQSSTLPPHALEEANAKYPALENDDQYTSEPIESTFSDMSKFPQVPTTIDAESIASSKSKFIPEPEPLIEL
jgi:growth factor-regulated tyrosine kinase substrate